MSGKPRSLAASFATVTTLFFTWGFITSVIDPLIPSVRAIFSLNYAESMLTQFAFFLAYGVVSLPGGLIVARLGYARSIIFALLAMLAGCLFVPVATYFDTYALVLVALFVIAGGITILQVAANPLAAALGKPEGSHFRLTLSQAFNSLGTVIGPFFGTMVMLRGGVFTGAAGAAATAAGRAQSLRNIDTSFLIVAGLIVLLVGFIWLFRRRLSDAAPPAGDQAKASLASALRSPWAVFGAIAIFVYVGSEVSIGSLMINFLHQKDVLGVSLEQAGKLVSFYWLGAMVGRFVGSALLTRIAAHRLLSVVAVGAAALCLGVNQLHGPVVAAVVISIGLLNSIMFPTIFTLTLGRSTASTAATSGLLCFAIVGGAVLPMAAGLIADSAGLHAAYLVPLVGYVCIALFAFGAGRARVSHPEAVAAGVTH
jgi:FHS family L-fucose permease-like MFS transporter